MKSNADYVRQELKEARAEKGLIAKIVRGAEVDRRTLDRFKDDSYHPHASTVDKLAAYFKRQQKKEKA